MKDIGAPCAHSFAFATAVSRRAYEWKELWRIARPNDPGEGADYMTNSNRSIYPNFGGTAMQQAVA